MSPSGCGDDLQIEGTAMRRRGVIGVDVNGGGGISISPTSQFWDELEELRREQEALKDRSDRYGCLSDQLSLFPELE
jgi:hypothetical protein